MSGGSPDLSENSSGSEEEYEEYDVESIRKWRYNRESKEREFFIKWRGWSEDDNTWEPEGHLNCPEPMDEFIKSLTKKQLKYFNAKNPDYLTGLQRNAEIKSITSDVSSKNSQDGAGSSQSGTNASDDWSFCLMVVFEDGGKEAEEVSMDDLIKERPEDAFEWIERRLIDMKALKNRNDVL